MKSSQMEVDIYSESASKNLIAYADINEEFGHSDVSGKNYKIYST